MLLNIVGIVVIYLRMATLNVTNLHWTFPNVQNIPVHSLIREKNSKYFYSPIFFWQIIGRQRRGTKTARFSRTRVILRKSSSFSSTFARTHFSYSCSFADCVLDQLFNLKFTSKQMQRMAKKSEKNEKQQKLKLKQVRHFGHWLLLLFSGIFLPYLLSAQNSHF